MNVKASVRNFKTCGLEIYRDENRAWQGVPSIVRTRGGRLLATFVSGGIYEPDPRNCCLLVYSDDDGESWSAPVLSIEGKPEEYIRASDGELWLAPNGSLWLIWAEIPYPAGLPLPTYEQKIDMENDSEYHQLESQVRMYAAICEEPDGEELIFGEARCLFNGYQKNRPFVTPSGRWLFPTWITAPREYYEFYYSDDEGKTFHPTRAAGRPPKRHFDEPCFYLTEDGRIGVLVRVTGQYQMRMFSADDGLTWSTPEPFLEVASQRPSCKNDVEKGVWAITSIHPKNRNGLRLWYSEDGIDFEERLILDDRERVSYAEMEQDESGDLYVIYDRERNNKVRKSLVTGQSEAAKEILFARIPRKVLLSGAVDENTVRARIISKAKINHLKNKFTEE